MCDRFLQSLLPRSLFTETFIDLHCYLQQRWYTAKLVRESTSYEATIDTESQKNQRQDVMLKKDAKKSSAETSHDDAILQAREKMHGQNSTRENNITPTRCRPG